MFFLPIQPEKNVVSDESGESDEIKWMMLIVMI